MPGVLERTKQCSRCKEDKPLDAFTTKASVPGGRSRWCRSCTQAYARDYNKNLPPEGRVRLAEQKRSSYLKSTFGITLSQYRDLLAAQGGRCANKRCVNKISSKREMPLDHDRTCCPGDKSCGKCIRGVLCNGCNLALGFVGESAEALSGLLDYLVSSRQNRSE